jgi:hypothetical protein
MVKSCFNFIDIFVYFIQVVQSFLVSLRQKMSSVDSLSSRLLVQAIVPGKAGDRSAEKRRDKPRRQKNVWPRFASIRRQPKAEKGRAAFGASTKRRPPAGETSPVQRLRQSKERSMAADVFAVRDESAEKTEI